jgi:hypothetical protein
MTEEQKTAKHLLIALGKNKSLDHIAFVLSPDFELKKPLLVKFWNVVRKEILTREI